MHAAHLFIDNMGPGQVLLKLDFKNAINCLRRDKMLMAVAEHTPELPDFIYSAMQNHHPSSGKTKSSSLLRESSRVTPWVPYCFA